MGYFRSAPPTRSERLEQIPRSFLEVAADVLAQNVAPVSGKAHRHAAPGAMHCKNGADMQPDRVRSLIDPRGAKLEGNGCDEPRGDRGKDLVLPDLPWERLPAGVKPWREPLHVVVKTRVTTGVTEEPKILRRKATLRRRLESWLYGLGEDADSGRNR